MTATGSDGGHGGYGGVGGTAAAITTVPAKAGDGAQGADGADSTTSGTTPSTAGANGTIGGAGGAGGRPQLPPAGRVRGVGHRAQPSAAVQTVAGAGCRLVRHLWQRGHAGCRCGAGAAVLPAQGRAAAGQRVLRLPRR